MASGDYLAVFSALHNVPPSSAYATFDFRNGHPVIDFDDTTDENALFESVLPSNYGGGGITVDLHWAATSATSNTCRWAVAIERIGTGSQDTDSDGFASAQTAGTTAPATSGHVAKTSIAFTNGAQMDSLAAGELFRVKVTRDADGTSGTDNMTGDAELFAVVVRET